MEFCFGCEKYYFYRLVSIFRELLLCHNLIRSLPYEIGKLFHLQILGLQGNPINKECLKIYNEPNGTHKLISFLLDSLAGKSELIVIIFYLSKVNNVIKLHHYE